MRAIASAAFILTLAVSTAAIRTAYAEPDTPSTQTAPEDILVEGISKLMLGLEVLLRNIPQYAAPEITPEGDIIIRRQRPQSEPQPQPQQEEQDSGVRL